MSNESHLISEMNCGYLTHVTTGSTAVKATNVTTTEMMNTIVPGTRRAAAGPITLQESIIYTARVKRVFERAFLDF